MLLPYKSRARSFSWIFPVSRQSLLFYVITVVRIWLYCKKSAVITNVLMFKSQLSLFYRRHDALLNKLIKNEILILDLFLNLNARKSVSQVMGSESFYRDGLNEKKNL